MWTRTVTDQLKTSASLHHKLEDKKNDTVMRDVGNHSTLKGACEKTFFLHCFFLDVFFSSSH